MERIFNVNVLQTSALDTPAEVIREFPLDESDILFVQQQRCEISQMIQGTDTRLLCVVGPCSIHDIDVAIEYANRLKTVSEIVSDKIKVVMRVYFEKPRTTVGWKGLINDPDLNGTFNINKGLRMARKILHSIIKMRIPTACEFLDTISPQYICDLVCWGAIGARTVESQVHRQLASGLSVPIGFKNRTDGNVKVAIDAIEASQSGHCFLGVDINGTCVVVQTLGNKDSHIVLRGGVGTPNYDYESIIKTRDMLQERNILSRIMVDCSHDNSGKNYKNQKCVLHSVMNTIDKLKDNIILGVMIESNLVEGTQVISNKMTYGKSITDGCIGWQETTELIYNIYNKI